MNPIDPPRNDPRNPWVTLLLSLMCPGFGHVYLGHAERGVFPALASYALIWGLGRTGALADFSGFATALTLLLVLYVGLAVDAWRMARGQRAYLPKVYNRRAPHIVFALVLVGVPGYLIAEHADLLGVEFRLEVGTDTMRPTLRAGDAVLVDTWAYRGAEPRIGDVVVYLLPADEDADGPRFDIARIAGLPGDRVALRDGRVWRNGVVEPRLDVPTENRAEDYSRDMDAETVPPGSVALFADWRDRARDSRFRGPYPRVGLTGRVTAIWWSPDRARIGRTVE